MKRLRAALQLNNSHCVAKQLGLFLTQTFFLWMFFTAGSLERLAELDLISGPPGADVRHLTFAFAARWRHGMTGGWPLYMPGFFVTAVAVWFWVYGLTWRKIIAEYAVMMGLAVVVALLFLPASHSFIVAAFQQQTGLQCEAEGLTVAARVIGQGLFTLINWSSFVGACQFCLVQKSFRPLWLPAGLSLVLVLIRPFTADEFTSFWRQQIWQGEVVAIVSALLIPLLSAWFVWMLPATPAIVSAWTPARLHSIRAEK
ncbi:MAG: hypothetical protein IPG76_12145 [Acidobacteria bacterium]|nr:hypothetical protein [Acidobacteriota bacterium]